MSNSRDAMLEMDNAWLRWWAHWDLIAKLDSDSDTWDRVNAQGWAHVEDYEKRFAGTPYAHLIGHVHDPPRMTATTDLRATQLSMVFRHSRWILA